MFCSDSSVRFATSLLFDVARYNLAGLGYFYINFLEFPLLKIKKKYIQKGKTDVKCLVMRLSEREFCSRHMRLSGDIHPWYID